MPLTGSETALGAAICTNLGVNDAAGQAKMHLLAQTIVQHFIANAEISFTTPSAPFSSLTVLAQPPAVPPGVPIPVTGTGKIV